MVARREVIIVTRSERFEQLDGLLTEHDGMLQTSQVIASGIVKPIFYEYVKEKKLQQVAHGIYVSEDTWVDTMFLLHLRCSQAVFSHETALYFHDLTDREPSPYAVTVRRGYSTTRLKAEGILTDVAKIQKGMYPYTFITCSQAQKLASNMCPNNSETTSLMFGIQWDLVCKYLELKSDLNKEEINSDSGSWGNYASVSFSVSDCSYAVLNQDLNELQKWSKIHLTYEKLNSGAENKVLFTTGATKRNSKMNIYDMAGNAIEWTLEHGIGKNTDSPCTFRGGSYAHISSERPLTYRGLTTTTYSNLGYSFRPVLY